MTARAALALLLLAPAPAQAEPWTCEMTVRCQDVTCDPIAERTTLIAADHEGRLFLTSPAGDRPVTRLTPPGALPATYAGAVDGSGTAAQGELFTIFGDGRAILSAHGPNDTARTSKSYGTCRPF